MSTTDDIRAAVTPTVGDDDEQIPIVVFRSEASAPRVLAALLVWFDGDDNRSGVEVWIGDEHVGRLNREPLLALSDQCARGSGAATTRPCPVIHSGPRRNCTAQPRDASHG